MNNIKFKGTTLAKLSFVGAVTFSFMCSSITSVNAGHHGNVYGPYPITEKSYKGTKKNSVSYGCLLYTSPSPRDKRQSRMPSSA